MATNPVFSAIVPEVLIEENYETWSVCIQNYLLSQDLWSIIEPESTPIENTSEFDLRKKNATALHAIQISCGSKLLYQIRGCKTAKDAWIFLAKKCSPQTQGDRVSSSNFKETELVDQASHRFNSALRRLKLLNARTGAKEKEARTNESQTLMLIRKVPPQLRKENFMTCYEPSVVSIGPYHHKCDRRLQQVEDLKELIAKQFVDQLTEIKDVDEIFRQFKEKFDRGIKRLYDENVTKDIGEEIFKRMMFLDGCFILYFVFCIQFNVVEKMGLKNHLIALVQQDLFLVENQLPFQVLEMLMSLSAYGRNGMYVLEDFIEVMNTCRRRNWMRYRHVLIEEPLHLLDFVWKKVLGNYEEINKQKIEINYKDFRNIQVENENHINRHLFHGVNELTAAGIQFHGVNELTAAGINELTAAGIQFHGVNELTAAGIHFRPNSSGSLRDIKFRSYGIYGTLTLPCMTIERSTRQMFLNLMAYEAYMVHMCNLEKSWFTSYICFLDLLIDHAEDVKALRIAGILENYLDSDEEVAKLFNEIDSELLLKVDTYRGVKVKIQRYLGNKRRVKIASWVAEVIRDHFKSPWTIIALLAGIIVISLTFVQTYFTIFPRSK